MKELYLVRHAKSSWKNPDLDDFDRPLNKRGKRDAPFMGELLMENSVYPDLLISSPAKRAIITAETIAKKINYPLDEIETNEDIYEADVQNLLDIIYNLPNELNKVMLFGHNPSFTILNNFLGDRRIDNIPTCGIVHLEFNVDKWNEIDSDVGKVISFEYPKKYSS